MTTDVGEGKFFKFKLVVDLDGDGFCQAISTQDRCNTHPDQTKLQDQLILVSLFQCHINSCGLFNAKEILVEEQLRYYLIHSWEIKGFMPLSKALVQK